jgi:DHA1 family tetracycline resistance protein-like MFS transporter
MPIFALAGIGNPAFQALATRQVDQARQGQLQGVLTSAVSLASIVGPLAFSTIYFIAQKEWPGAIWLSVVVIYVIAVPLVFLGTRTARPAQLVSALASG